MRTWTAVTPSTMALPQDLALLLAPVRLADATGAKDPVGRAEGVLLDDEGNLVAFVVRLSWRLAAGNPRTLVPASAMTLADDTGLVLAWPQEKLLEQPRLDKDLQRQDAGEAGAPAVASPEVRAVEPAPGEGRVDVSETVKEGAEGTAIGAVVGGILGGLAGGPLLGFALAAFFATGGGLIGFISGGGQQTGDTPEDAKPQHLATVPVYPAFQRLEERLRDPALATDGLVHTTRFSPMATNEGILEPQPVLAHAS